MTVTGNGTYDAPISAVLAMLRDEKCWIERYESQGHHDVEVIECDEHEGGIRVVTTRVVTVELPNFAKKVLKPTNSIRQTDVWDPVADDSWKGSFDVEIAGAPVHVSGVMTLMPDGDTTTHDVAIDLRVKVPLIGGKIADWVVKNDVRPTLEIEFDFNVKWLAEHA